MSDTVTGTRRQRLQGSVASVLGFGHLAGLVQPAATATRVEPTITAPAADGDAEPKRHPDGKFKGKKKDGDAGDENEDLGGEEDEDEDGDKDSDKKEASTAARGSVRNARLRERARCAAILSAPEAAANIQLAVHLACNTDQDRATAIETLKHGGAGGGLAARMAAQPSVNIGPGAERPTGKPPQKAIDASWDEAISKVTARRR